MAQNTLQTTPGTADVVDLLVEQHGRVRALLDRVVATSGEDRQAAFDEVRELLARHETGEEMILRPLTQRLPGGKEIASGRMDEENEAKVHLAELEKMDVDSAEFARAFEEFRSAVLEHAAAEEQQEFTTLRADADTDRLVAARGMLEKAEATAPTHPHPSAKTVGMNYVAGPFAAMLDRARDTLSKVT